jgi:two-component system, NtrC family, sensor kinase
VTFYSVPPLITAILSFGLGIFILLRNRESKLNWTFASWCFLTTYWQTCWTVLFNVHNVQTADLLARLGYSGIIFIPIVFFHFVIEFTKSARGRFFSYAFYVLGGIFFICTWQTSYFVGGVYHYPWGYYPLAGVLHLVYLLFLLIMLLSGLRLLWRFKCQSLEQPTRLNQTKYIIASTIIYSMAGVDFLANYGFAYYPLGLIFTNIHACIIAYAIIQYRLLDVSVAIKRSLIYALILVALLLPCYVIVIQGQWYAFGEISYTFSLVTLLLFIGVGFLFPKFRFKTEDALERVLFKKRVDFRDTLLSSSRDMVSIIDIKALSNNLVRTIGKSLGIDKVSLLLHDEAKGSHLLVASLGLDLDHWETVFLPRGSQLIQLLQRRREAIVKEELEWVPVGPETPQTIETMAKLGAEISLPIISKEKLIGILNLGHKGDKTLYSNEDLELLSTLANQAAIAIENARLYENLKQSQDTLRRADRLSSLGLLTAGLAHEIRNPLVAIRTFTQLLPERYDDAEFREGFQGLALKEVDRICGLINDLLSFARPSKPNVAPENINDVIENIARILETQAKEKNVAILRELGDNLPKVWIDREQMKQVFMNLILNAIQAMRDGGSINISSRPVSRNGTQPSGDFVQVEIRDSGIGIPEENLQHIFDPFFTSKDEGSGLGLAVSHQIVQEHGGFVTVESQVGKGTAFFVHVPVGKPLRPVTNGRAHTNEANPSH